MPFFFSYMHQFGMSTGRTKTVSLTTRWRKSAWRGSDCKENLPITGNSRRSASCPTTGTTTPVITANGDTKPSEATNPTFDAGSFGDLLDRCFGDRIRQKIGSDGGRMATLRLLDQRIGTLGFSNKLWLADEENGNPLAHGSNGSRAYTLSTLPSFPGLTTITPGGGKTANLLCLLVG